MVASSGSSSMITGARASRAMPLPRRIRTFTISAPGNEPRPQAELDLTPAAASRTDTSCSRRSAETTAGKTATARCGCARGSSPGGKDRAPGARSAAKRARSPPPRSASRSPVRGERRGCLIEVPAEAPIDQPLPTEQRQRRCEQPRRQRGDDSLQVPGDRERARVSGAERGVVLERLDPGTPLLEHGGQFTPARDAEIQGRADALPRQGKAMTGRVANEEDRVLGGGAEAVREPVALVTDGLQV